MRNGVRALAGALLVVGLTPVLAPTRPAAASGGNAVTVGTIFGMFFVLLGFTLFVFMLLPSNKRLLEASRGS